MLIFEIWDDSIKGEEKVVNQYEFNNLEEARKYACLTRDINVANKLDYAYFIVDDKDDVYTLSDEEDDQNEKERKLANFLFRVAATIQVDQKTFLKIAENARKNLNRNWSPDDPVEEGIIKPKYNSWEEFISQTTERERLSWCRQKANKANSKRLLSSTPKQKINASDVWKVLKSAKGRCFYCGSLALEHQPMVNGKQISWAYMGRRIGTLHHISKDMMKDYNNFNNLRWACMWCNSWSIERKKGAEDHGGYC